jgi:hypothetical protein
LEDMRTDSSCTRNSSQQAVNLLMCKVCMVWQSHQAVLWSCVLQRMQMLPDMYTCRMRESRCFTLSHTAAELLPAELYSLSPPRTMRLLPNMAFNCTASAQVLHCALLTLG